MTTQNARRVQRRPQRLAEVVAVDLRERILTARYADGAMLPKQEELADEFGVSLPTVREALRELETEGLVRVIRGNIGGSVVRLPQPDSVARMLGVVLQSRSTSVDDLAYAMRLLQPLCAGECAGRRDRRRSVVPALREAAAAAEAAIDDAAEFARLARGFHETLVERCGNETFIVLIGALERLWSAQVEGISTAADLGEFASPRTRLRSIEEHRQLVQLIADGDVEAAREAARQHMGEPMRHGLLGRSRLVSTKPLHEPRSRLLQ